MRASIKQLVMDVDGTLTDVGVYIGVNGEIMKRFYIHDGYAIKHILPKYGIIPIIITGRQSEIVQLRCAELNIKEIYQKVDDKIEQVNYLIEKYQISFEDLAYIGDDLNDLEVMKMAGLSGCPADAVDEVKKISNFIALKNGGCGAVRDFIEWILKDKENNDER